MIRVHREAKSRLSVEVTTATNPDTATIQFAFPLRGQRPSTWVSGSWFADAVLRGETWYREALTPRIGDQVVLVPGLYRFFAKLVIGSDEDVWEVDDKGLEIV